jgi:hypothetical protein
MESSSSGSSDVKEKRCRMTLEQQQQKSKRCSNGDTPGEGSMHVLTQLQRAIEQRYVKFSAEQY